MDSPVQEVIILSINFPECPHPLCGSVRKHSKNCGERGVQQSLQLLRPDV